MTEAPVIGIDLGTTYSCVGVFQFGKVEIIADDRGNKTTPSYVAFVDYEQLMDVPAKDQAARNINNTIFDVKRLIGRKFNDDTVQADIKLWPFQVINDMTTPKIQIEIDGKAKTYFPEEISSMIFTKMKNTAEAYLGKTVKKAVITVPAYFNSTKRRATNDAATIAGLEVLFIINEPSAAAIAYGFGKDNSGERERTALIFNLGGGNFDVSIVTLGYGIIDVRSTVGDTHLGGEDFTNRMVHHFIEVFKRRYKKDLSQNQKALRRFNTVCERAKRTLSSFNRACIEINSLYKGIDFYTWITRAYFEELNEDLFRSLMETVEKAILDAGVAKREIDDIVLVGGSSRIPKLQRMLRDFFGGKILIKSVNPDEAVAFGAAIHAAILNGDKSKNIRDLLLLDVTPLPLGINIEGDLMAVVIKRNCKIAARNTGFFTTTFDNQTVIRIEVFEGEFEETKYNTLLGEFELNGISPAPAGIPEIEVTFSMSVYGILTVIADEKNTGTQNWNEITISCNRNRHRELEIRNIIQETKEYKVEEEKRGITLAAKNALESYCVNMKKIIEDDNLKDVIDKSVKDMILKKYNETFRWLSLDKLAEKEKYELKQIELESMFSLIIKLAEEPKAEIRDVYREAVVKHLLSRQIKRR